MGLKMFGGGSVGGADYIRPGVRLSDQSGPIYMGHRGGSLQVPESTIEGFRAAVAQGVKAIEFDCYLLADGTLGVIHNATVDGTTTATGPVGSHTGASFQRLAVDAGTWFGAGYPNDLHHPTLDQVCREFGNKVLLVPQAYEAGTMGRLIETLAVNGISRDAVIVQSFNLADCILAANAGWPTMLLAGTVTQAASNGIQWLGLEHTTITTQVVTDAHTAGVKVAAYAPERRYHRDIILGYGVDAIMSGDPLYLAGVLPPRKTDLFAAGVPIPGMQVNTGAWEFANGYVGWGTEVSRTMLLGCFKPTSAANFTMNFALKMVSAPAGANSAYIWIGENDKHFTSAPAVGQKGYQFIIRKNGQLDVYYYDGTTAAATYLGGRGDAFTTDLVMGADTPYRITITPTTVGVGRTDLDEPAIGAGLTHSAVRGDRITFGTNGSAASIKSVVLS